MPFIAISALAVALLLTGLPSGNASAAAASALWRVAPREAWVQPAPAPYGDVAQGPAAAGLLLHDRQIHITAEGDDRYEHLILRLTAAQAAAQEAPVNIGVDPRFQELVIHALRLTRRDDAAREFTAAQIRQQLRTQSAEAEPYKRDLDPQLQLSLTVPDARAGDVLECEYTLHSRTAQYQGLFAGHYAAQWSPEADQAVRWERLHVSWPPERVLQFRVSAGGPGVAPQVRSRTGELDVQWRNLAPVAADLDTPRWFDRNGMVELSDFSDWAQVATLLAPQYSGIEPHELPTQPAANAVPGLILNALRLLQAKVHPLNGIASGAYLPADPALLLQRGYGDGHDLARTLASLLRRLGLDAQVALADSHRGEVLAQSLPSPFILDSALVVVRSGEAQYWLNPAAPGSLAGMEGADTADLRHALLIAVAGGRIVSLPQPAPDSRLRSISEQFDLRTADTQAVPFTVTTQYRGSWAQAMRAEWRGQSPAQLQLMQIQDLLQNYPQVTADGDVRLQDLADTQTLQLTARFRLPRALGSARDPHFDFFAQGLAEVVQPRDEPTRQFPLSVPWPLKLEQHIEALLPPDALVPAGSIKIETAAFRYQRDVRVRRGTLEVTHSYVALSDHVEPADYPRFVQANAQVYEALRLRVGFHGTPWRSALEWLQNQWPMIIAVIVGLAALSIAALRRLRRR
jgi:hypothetical protein